MKPTALLDSSEAAYLATELIENRMKEQESGEVHGIQFSVPELQDIIRPIYPGEIAFLLGHSRNGKSFVAKKVLYDETKKLFEQGKTDTVNVIVTWEEPAEVLAMSWLAVMSGISSTKMLKGLISRTELDDLKSNVIVKVGMYPIYIIGMSSKRNAQGKREKVDLSLDTVEKCLDWIMNTQMLEIKVIVYDYLQRIPQPARTKRDIHILNCVDWVKNSGFWTNAAVLCCTQATKESLKANPPIPDLYDSEWSANAAQSGDFAFSVWMAKNNYPINARVERLAGYENFQISPTMQFLKVLKQKGAADGQLLCMDLRPDFLQWRMHTAYYDTPLAKESGHRFNPNRPFM